MVRDPICSDPDPAHCLRVARARALPVDFDLQLARLPQPLCPCGSGDAGRPACKLSWRHAADGQGSVSQLARRPVAACGEVRVRGYRWACAVVLFDG